MPRHNEKLAGDAELLQGTLDMLILKVVAIQPIHGYGIVQRLGAMSREALWVRQGVYDIKVRVVAIRRHGSRPRSLQTSD